MDKTAGIEEVNTRTFSAHTAEKVRHPHVLFVVLIELGCGVEECATRAPAPHTLFFLAATFAW